MTAVELFDFYRAEKVSQLKAYLPIIENSPVYPVIYDANRVVLSMPPIINGDHSKITLETKNVFIECTATDLTKANVVLQMIVSAFSEYCATPFQFESVKIVDADGQEHVTPRMDSRSVEV
jgi:phenylalanyl-tRNA synthetase beta chain